MYLIQLEWISVQHENVTYLCSRRDDRIWKWHLSVDANAHSRTYGICRSNWILWTLIFISIHTTTIPSGQYTFRLSNWVNTSGILTNHSIIVTIWLSNNARMSYVAKGEKEYDATGAPVPQAKIHKIRITLTSSNVKNLEKCAFIIRF